MADTRVVNFAKLLIHYSLDVKPGHRVLVTSNPNLMPVLKEIYREILRAGAHPMIIMGDNELSEILLKEGSAEQIGYVDATKLHAIESADRFLSIQAPQNTRSLASVDNNNLALFQKAQLPIRQSIMKRSAAGKVEWTVTRFPCHALAQEADMSLSEYEDFFFRAARVDMDDPIAEWQRINKRQQILIDWITPRKNVHVTGPNIDLTLSIEGRTWLNGDGHRNLPCGEFFTAPIEDSVNGWVHFTYPVIYNGHEVIGAKLRFENGRVVEASADKGEAFLLSTLDTDEGARTLGEFAIGTNTAVTEFTKSILFDEKLAGSIHMAVGMAYPESGGVNQSAIHWDMICDMRDGGKIMVDGELFYDSGRFPLLDNETV